MAGKRLLDAAKLFNAGRSVAKQHFGLRREQWEVYSQTSSLAKAVKSQTDKVTVTAGAAYELARRFNESGPQWQPQQTGTAEQRRPEDIGSDWRRNTPQNNRANTGPSDAPSNEDEARAAGAQVRSQRDGDEHDDGTLSSLRKRELQRIAERQIPQEAADAQPELKNEEGHDTFKERGEHSSPELSSLPRSKIPKEHVEAQESDEHVDNRGINSEIFTSRGHESEVKNEDLPEGASVDGAFHSPRISQMLGQAGSKAKNPYANRQKLPPKPLPEMVAAEKERESRASAAATSHEATPAQSEPVPEAQDVDVEKLAQSIAQDAESSPTPTSTAASTPASTETSYEMRESRVPTSRFGRLWQYSGLATSMAFGAVGESFRRVTGGGSGEGSLMLSEGNMNRLVAKLSRMRGAALKLGQMMSFQDSKLLPPTINAVLQRVQDSADYMPSSQRDKVLVGNLGQNWRDLFSNFEERPFAAASIGQVHKATLASNGKDVAVKVQYPGVRNSIDSDLNNLSLLLTASKLLPKGLYLDKTIANARTELAWECDYEREADACIRFASLLRDETDIFTVPEIYKEASGAGVLTAEFMHGTAVTKMKDLTQADRDWVGTQILRLCLRELMEWRFMQTDPNWTNFLYNRDSSKLELLDFGASRDFPVEFVEPYVGLLIAASKGDRDSCRDLSIQLGYLTGHERKAMLDAHVDSILTLAEPFVESAPEVYNFDGQTITDRVRSNIGLMLRERLAPPPEETYSLHRKLSGAFLLCARLRSQVRARDMFADAVKVWEGRKGKVEAGA